MKKLFPIFFAFFLALSAEARLSPLAPKPDWSSLDKFQQTITKGDFLSALEKIYAPGGAWKGTISLTDDSAVIETAPGRPPYVLKFAADGVTARPLPISWRPRSALSATDPSKPLAGLKIAIDPGHLGGSWAKMEERWFQIGKTRPVTEGDMTLKVAKLLSARLKALGAEVFLTRSKPGPVTSARPAQLRGAAVGSLQQKKEPVTKQAVTKESERLFYRVSEIRRRARLVNEAIQPDLVLCLHFNAEDWGDERKPRLVEENHLHFLVTGAWSGDELSYEDQRLDMLVKLLNRSHGEEISLAHTMAGVMAKATGLPPYTYHGGSVIRVGDSPYVWGRNLLANRLFHCPVVYFEPYVMNSRPAFARIQAGDYEGLKSLGGSERKSIYREYADAVTAGLVNYYSQRSP
ncbi:MAG: N-acetylmuramoyl-L-alanine amidase [Chthoniobacterales bacterium]|nr:N-acetylmuramoyl-L-alanine amidase [Chthoniobacterales bacterium]